MKWSAMIGASRQALRREAVLAALVHVFALCRAARGAVVFPTLLGGRPSPSIPSGTVAAWPRAVVRRLCSFVCATLVLCGVKRRWLARRRLALRVFATLEKSACRVLSRAQCVVRVRLFGARAGVCPGAPVRCLCGGAPVGCVYAARFLRADVGLHATFWRFFSCTLAASAAGSARAREYR